MWVNKDFLGTIGPNEIHMVHMLLWKFVGQNLHPVLASTTIINCDIWGSFLSLCVCVDLIYA